MWTEHTKHGRHKINKWFSSLTCQPCHLALAWLDPYFHTFNTAFAKMLTIWTMSWVSLSSFWRTLCTMTQSPCPSRTHKCKRLFLPKGNAEVSPFYLQQADCIQNSHLNRNTESSITVLYIEQNFSHSVKFLLNSSYGKYQRLDMTSTGWELIVNSADCRIRDKEWVSTSLGLIQIWQIYHWKWN